ncbi:hypothetical protein CK203_046339 [Vitis vinifera]|uniref:Disease resistance protein At4g27190-like leucine-rich repeats domain-containing protein n=1 Tax=Vitis vinifera TaxID=29760 RepID=A0A438FWE9_VITVI|nr:hypothetical protein CK203_046339 [Vitis vinifera]
MLGTFVHQQCIEVGKHWQGPVYPVSLAQLKNLTLSKCPELKKILSKGMIQQLPQLQYLRVEDCRQIEEIVMESENNGLEAMYFQRIKISMCNMLRRLPFNNANATKLRFIEG